MKVRTFLDLMDGYFEIRQFGHHDILYKSDCDDCAIFDIYKDYKIVGFSATSRTEIDNYDNVTVMPGVIIYV